jgi:hypothetical protein
MSHLKEYLENSTLESRALELYEQVQKYREVIRLQEEAYDEEEDVLDKDEHTLASEEPSLWKTYAAYFNMSTTPTQSSSLDPGRSILWEYFTRMGDAAILRERLDELRLRRTELVQDELRFQPLEQQKDSQDLQVLETFDSDHAKCVEEIALCEREISKHAAALEHEVKNLDNGPEHLLVNDKPFEKDYPRLESGIKAYLPDDFVMRGHLWCEQYHPSGFFGDCPADDVERPFETPSMSARRAERCLYLGIKLSTVGNYNSITVVYSQIASSTGGSLTILQSVGI